MKKLVLLTLLSLFALSSCTMRQAVNIALSDDPGKALEALAEAKADEYRDDPFRAMDDLEMAKADFERLMSRLKKVSAKVWGEKEAELPTRTKYVKYTENYNSRAVVDYDSGEVVVESIKDSPDAEAQLRSAVVTTILTPSDPRSVDMFSDKEVELTGTPYMYGLVEDERKKPITTPREAERYADHLVKNNLRTRTVETDSGKKEVAYVKFEMVEGHLDKRAARFEPAVARFAASASVSKSLVFAIMKTESAFNPYAVSPVPAYGLMQLVPTSGGKDAYRKIKGSAEAPTKEYLFVPDNNIELGTAYLNILTYDYLSKIKDPLSREYCVIAAYNTGSGNVMKAFSRNRSEALEIINSMSAPAVYEKLKKDLPYEETRNYIIKVVGSRKDFSKL